MDAYMKSMEAFRRVNNKVFSQMESKEEEEDKNRSEFEYEGGLEQKTMEALSWRPWDRTPGCFPPGSVPRLGATGTQSAPFSATSWPSHEPVHSRGRLCSRRGMLGNSLSDRLPLETPRSQRGIHHEADTQGRSHKYSPVSACLCSVYHTIC